MKQERRRKNRIKIIAIGGPTASGKTAASLILAKKFNGAIINCDSRQIYRELDIATDKISYTLPYRDPIKFHDIDHYGINIATLKKVFTLYDWQKYAKKIIKQIIDKRQIPFLVGGTGLYIQAIVKNYQLNSGYDQELREVLTKMSLSQLQTELKKINKKLFAQIDNQNPRRLIRTIEKSKLKNGIQNVDSGSKADYDSLVLSFFPDNNSIKEKIALRVEEHLKKGVLDEVKKLVKKYGPDHPILNATISIKEYIPYILGRISLVTAKEQVCRNNYHYAKRQMTWFRKYGDTVFCKDVEEMEKKIREFLKKMPLVYEWQ